VQAVEVIESAAVHLGAGRRQRGGGGVRAGLAEDLVSRAEQFRDDGRTDMSGCSSDKHAHM
jgi:hypothetical protein